VERPTAFRHVPGEAEVEALTEALDLLGLRKARLEGTLAPEGRADWRLQAHLGATVVQPCSVSLKPVTTRIEEPVTVLYTADYRPPAEGEAEMPDDETTEPLPETVDLAAILAEALALALPPFPRAGDAELGETAFGPPGAEPLRDADVHPFAALSPLKGRDSEE